jgi:hypothetical protein
VFTPARGPPIRLDLLDLLAAEETALAGVRIERRDRDPWRRNALRYQRLVAEHDLLVDARFGDLVARLAQRHVVGEQHETHVAEQQHHRVAPPRLFGEDLVAPRKTGGASLLLTAPRRCRRSRR